jgi:beta-glucosidase
MKQDILYKDSNQSIENRVTDLLARMTLEEKVGQMMQLDGKVHKDKLESWNLGSFLQCDWGDIPEIINRSLKTRLGIPILLANDCIHGFSFWKGATIFPTQLAGSCSWNESLIKEMGEITAREMRYAGTAWTFSPVLCIARDLRWGRVGETFGEDPFLIGKLGNALINGYQGSDLSNPNSVMACAKHYAGYSETLGGRDASEAELSKRKLRSFFLPPFQQASEIHCSSYMTGYQSIDGQPSTANKWLLREVLRDEWGFEGLLVTDWNNVGHMVENQKICKSYAEAASLAVAAGNDLIMSTPAFYDGALKAVKEGMLSESLIDESVRRILTLKFRLGLFENPRLPDFAELKKVAGCEAHRKAALELARKSAVLLSNKKLLPLSKNVVKKIAVIGTNADDHLAQLGDWSLGSGQACKGEQPREAVVTILDGLRKKFSGEIIYARGCGITESNLDEIPFAVAAAKSSDVAVVVVGDKKGLIGEGLSTATLELQGGQQALLEAVRATGVPVVVVLIHSKPSVLPATVTNADAVLELFNPGMLGGEACAEILLGEICPSGKLTISVPRHIGQQPVFYNTVRGQHGTQYADLTQEPLYSFGYGLSYNEYRYSNVHLEKNYFTMDEVGKGTIRIFVDVMNMGKWKATEIVQAYISDLVTSATWPEKELKGFASAELSPGETKTVVIEIPLSECSMINTEGKRIVEPGEFHLMIGSSSRNCDLNVLPFIIAE